MNVDAWGRPTRCLICSKPVAKHPGAGRPWKTCGPECADALMLQRRKERRNKQTAPNKPTSVRCEDCGESDLVPHRRFCPTLCSMEVGT
jgi:hypothetical protein